MRNLNVLKTSWFVQERVRDPNAEQSKKESNLSKMRADRKQNMDVEINYLKRITNSMESVVKQESLCVKTKVSLPLM